MSYLAWLVPIALGMGVVGLMAFMWSMRSGQYDDPDGAAERVLLAQAADAPLPAAGRVGGETRKAPARARSAPKAHVVATSGSQGEGHDRDR
ncbi:cbb3-type cytochrome oxidase assembly protein CcoS [Hansschlegelia sp. KR7-227]|uniref:cbb3-type cytochrome oxidase assembly protein CcoS n=1 Tax=Hansschlegelia sp. KR7-227 TaxID=3400914 RepID=UPI003C01931C